MKESSDLAAESIADFIRSIEMATNQSGVRFKYVAIPLGELGATYEHLKDFERAKENYVGALDASELALKEDLTSHRYH